MNDALNELALLKQWVAFRKVQKNGEISKPPINIRTGKGEGWNTPEGMGTLEEAYTYAIMHDSLIASIPELSKGGIGFVFTENDCYAGIDLDHVIKNGKLTPEAEEIVALMDTYTELSLSGDGLHLIFKLSQSLDSLGLDITHKLPLSADSRIEIYDRAKYFTVSDKPYGEVKPIAERTQQCRQVCTKFCVKPKNTETPATTPATAPERNSSAINWKYNPDNYLPKGSLSVDTSTRSQDLSDSELWQRMFDSEHGRDIKALYDGDISTYGNDHSSADLALCSYLNYWTNGDPSRIDRMFRQSRLMREKWERKDYRDMTIALAINGKQASSQTSTPSTAKNSAGYDSDAPITGNTPNNRQNDSESNHRERAGSRLFTSHLADYLDFRLSDDLADFALYKNRKTGFSNFDKDNSLYPGLYAIGGVSGVGKTTFIHQITDNLARAGEYVMYFTLEQPLLDLASKGIARITAQESPAYACTALEFRNGWRNDIVEHAIRTYKSFAERIFIRFCDFNTSVDSIIQQVKDFMQKTGKKPVVVVDYLQILRPSKASERKGSKEAVDDTVHALKVLQADYGLIMFVISSFNRQNYLTVADFESFKESGLIEYSADFVAALQLVAMNADLLDKANKLIAKRELIGEEKKRNPRDIELLVLKNRYGRSYVSYFFTYDARHDLFNPNDIDKEQALNLIQARAKVIEDKHQKDNSGCKHRNSDGGRD